MLPINCNMTLERNQFPFKSQHNNHHTLSYYIGTANERDINIIQANARAAIIRTKFIDAHSFGFGIEAYRMRIPSCSKCQNFYSICLYCLCACKKRQCRGVILSLAARTVHIHTYTKSVFINMIQFITVEIFLLITHTR